LGDLATTIKNIAGLTDGGILVFFPSYVALAKFVKYVVGNKIDFGKLV
jgi:Rad3-related DNA helicase